MNMPPNGALNSKIKNFSTFYEELNLILSNGDIIITNNVVTGFNSQNYWRHTRVCCSSGDIFKISLNRSSNTGVSFHVVFTDINNNVLSKHIPYSGEGNIVDYEVTAPPSTANLYIQSILDTVVFLTVKKNVKAGNFSKNINDISYYFKEQAITLSNGSITVSNGYITSFGSQTYWRRTLVPCSAGDIFKISLSRSSNTGVSFHILFCDNIDKVLLSLLPYSNDGLVLPDQTFW